jgi:hypothetical protein
VDVEVPGLLEQFLWGGLLEGDASAAGDVVDILVVQAPALFLVVSHCSVLLTRPRQPRPARTSWNKHSHLTLWSRICNLLSILRRAGGG